MSGRKWKEKSRSEPLLAFVGEFKDGQCSGVEAGSVVDSGSRKIHIPSITSSTEARKDNK
jgi:hypothetical protein